MHESFSVDNPSKITREWFAWANSFFGEMIIHLALTNPSVLK
jgi:meiotically up-regulated gene 157 (Mug157) protein